MQEYDLNISNNTTRQLDARGNYFYYKIGSAGGSEAKISIKGIASGLRVTLLPGQAQRLEPGKEETSWLIENKAGVPINGIVAIGNGEFTDNRITGDVSVYDAVSSNVQTPFLAAPSLAVGINATQWISPSSNVNGANVRFLSVANTAGVGGNINSRVIASINQPVNLLPGANSIVLATIFNDTQSTKEYTATSQNRRIPAGWGVWLVSNINGANAQSNGGVISIEIF